MFRLVEIDSTLQWLIHWAQIELEANLPLKITILQPSHDSTLIISPAVDTRGEGRGYPRQGLRSTMSVWANYK